jgi:hypothetical protein
MTPRPPALEGETEREYAWRVYTNDAASINERAPTARCKQRLCRAVVWWGITRAKGRSCPFDVKPDGTKTGASHWRTCRQRPARKET